MNKDKLIERVRKLFAMSQDTSSPAEAAIAAARVRKLMDEHGITQADLETSEFMESDGQTCGAKRSLPGWYDVLAMGVARANDVICQRGKCTIYYNGYEKDVICATLMLDYLVGAMHRSTKEFSAKRKEAGMGWNARAENGAFRRGFASEMQKRLYALAKKRAEEVRDDVTGRALIPLKMALVNEKFGEQSSTTLNYQPKATGMSHGRAAARNVSLSTQVQNTTSQQKLIGN